MAASLEEDEDFLQNDYYALLNVSREASLDEINNAFRHLSRIYHPDKHVDPVQKKKAEAIFSKLRTAHDVLRDKTKRVIYDMFGEKGLANGDMEVIARTKTPAEIIAEYERLQNEREERRLQQRTNPRGNISVEINATDIFDVEYNESDILDYEPSRSIEISSMSIAQSVECPLTLKDTVVIGGNLETRNGIGNGMFSMVWRRLISDKGWAEVDFSLGSSSALGVTGFRQLTRRCHMRFGVRTDVTPHGYRPLGTMMLAYQFDRNLQGRMTFNISPSSSSIQSKLMYSTEMNNLSAALQIGVRSSFLALTCIKTLSEEKAKIVGGLRVGTLGSMVEFSVEKKITDFSHIGGTLVLGIPLGVQIKLKVLRGQQTFFFPIHLSEELNPSAIFYGTVIPTVSFYIIKNLIVAPFLKQQKERELFKQKEQNAEKMEERKQEAQRAVELMKETFQRSLETEEKKSGLVILKALYGKIQNADDSEMTAQTCLDVSVQLQSLVKDSKLIIAETSSKSGLPGFYDPSLNEEKHLYIRYKFRSRLHQVFLSDTEPIRLPQQKHLIMEEQHSSSRTS